MNIDFTKKSIAEQVKAIIKYRGLTQEAFREKYNQYFNTNYTKQSFSNKLVNNRIRADELQKIGEILDFDVELKLRD